MSQNILIVPFEPTKAKFTRRAILDVLVRGVECECPDGPFRYLDGSGGQTFSFARNVVDDACLDAISLDRFGGRIMMERLFQLADEIGCFLVWTDVCDDGPVASVTRPEWMNLIPDYARDLHFAVARDASHLNQLVKGATFEENGWV